MGAMMVMIGVFRVLERHFCFSEWAFDLNPGSELVGFWNWRVAFPVGGVLHKNEGFLRSIRPSEGCGGGNGTGFGWEWDAEDWGHVVFEDFENQIPIWSLECFGFLLMMMMMVVSLFFTKARDGPQGHAHNNDTADE